MHNTVELERVVDGLVKPTGVTYMNGVVYVAEESAVMYVDVWRGCEAETKPHAKTAIGGGANQKRTLGDWGTLDCCSDERTSDFMDK